MAANDYYTSSAYSRNDAPLPPPPGNPSTHTLSPVSSPFDEDSRYNSSHQNLAANPAPMGYGDTAYHGSSNNYQQNPYRQSSHSTDPFSDHNAIPLRDQGKMGGASRYETDPEGRMHPPGPGARQKRRWFSGRQTWVVYILTTIQICVFIAQLGRNGALTGSPIQTKPQFNIMIGPSPWVTINMGARFPPCMHNIRGVTDYPKNITWNCPWSTSANMSEPQNQCTLPQLCGMSSGVPDQIYPTPFEDRTREPNQWWRFIVPIFLHAGIIHLAFNMLLQLTLGRDMEKEIGPIRFALVYFSAGIFGFVLGGNYAAQMIPSVGASGSLFGILALTLLDLLYNWRTRRSPVKDLLFLLLDIAIAFVLGLLPGLDNFSHIGGFLMGLVLGICLLHSPAALRERIGVDEPPYATVDTAGALSASGAPAMKAFMKKPLGFFKGRKPLWWAWWLVRAGSLVAVLIGFILLLKNFYEDRRECSWCYRLSCLPIRDWCEIGKPKFEEIPAGDVPTETTASLAPTSTIVPALLAKLL
ncbi:rhomboid-domain-containing protein [Sporormia fimetaria CBS 119925]|uniref:Rhomboid-type serine protease n=1 Tax=Sporormia fimetaria CBS 119925 TaxID=1340428 RepID=A0A6A6V916_9PLEO|nr:rhomboid-domain-containing protein [Sporormia fimetaria CBS 119925]